MLPCAADNRNLRQSGARNNGPVAAATCSLGNDLVRAACFIGSKATNKGLDQFETAFMNCGCLVLRGKLQGVSKLTFVTVWLPCAGHFPLFSCRSRNVMWGSRAGVTCSNSTWTRGHERCVKPPTPSEPTGCQHQHRVPGFRAPGQVYRCASASSCPIANPVPGGSSLCPGRKRNVEFCVQGSPSARAGNASSDVGQTMIGAKNSPLSRRMAPSAYSRGPSDKANRINSETARVRFCVFLW